ncbi:macro domain-containing protein [Paenibacillus fonticola]|uniref:macro domain-containing protein n=1 Tax=Paenibacillus fonticola TaxID=379896 RepID=UPI00039E8DC6
MMIECRNGNLLKAEAEALVNAVNCVGVMGKGIALQFKQAFPDNFKEYSEGMQEEFSYPRKNVYPFYRFYVSPKIHYQLSNKASLERTVKY